jgi:hypothetical protein
MYVFAYIYAKGYVQSFKHLLINLSKTKAHGSTHHINQDSHFKIKTGAMTLKEPDWLIQSGSWEMRLEG